MRGVHHLYHDPVVQTGEKCCATDMTAYEKGIKKQDTVTTEKLLIILTSIMFQIEVRYLKEG